MHLLQVRWLFCTFAMWSLHENHFENGPMPKAKQEGGILVVPLRLGFWGVPSDITGDYLKFPRGMLSSIKAHISYMPLTRPPRIPWLLTTTKKTTHGLLKTFILKFQVPSASTQPYSGSWLYGQLGHAEWSCLISLGPAPYYVLFSSASIRSQSSLCTKHCGGPRPAKREEWAGSPPHIFLDQLCARELVRKNLLNKMLAILSRLLEGNIC